MTALPRPFTAMMLAFGAAPMYAVPPPFPAAVPAVCVPCASMSRMRTGAGLPPLHEESDALTSACVYSTPMPGNSGGADSPVCGVSD